MGFAHGHQHASDQRGFLCDFPVRGVEGGKTPDYTLYIASSV